MSVRSVCKQRVAGSNCHAGAWTQGTQRVTTSKQRTRDGEEARLSPKQQETLEAITEYWNRHGIPPARMDLARALGLRTSSAMDAHIHGLVQKGKIELVPGAGARAIRLVRNGEVPLITGLDEIPSDEPLRADARRVDRIAAALADRFAPRPDMFLLLASKELTALGLGPEDLLAVRETARAPDPDDAVLVGRLDGRITVGKFRRIGRKYVELTQLTRDGTPRTRRINLTRHDFAVEGVAVGAIGATAIPLANGKP